MAIQWAALLKKNFTPVINTNSIKLETSDKLSAKKTGTKVLRRRLNVPKN